MIDLEGLYEEFIKDIDNMSDEEFISELESVGYIYLGKINNSDSEN